MQNVLSSSLLSKNLKVKIYRAIILPVILYGCETWSVTLREERRLRVFEDSVLRIIFGLRREEVRGERRKLSNEEQNNLYCIYTISILYLYYIYTISIIYTAHPIFSDDKIEKNEMGGACSAYG